MRLIKLAVGIMAIPTTALSAPTEDAKCFLLSNGFSRQGSSAELKEIASYAHFYFLGRLNITATPTQAKEAILQARKNIVAATSSADMSACVQSMRTAERAAAAFSAEVYRELGEGGRK